MAGLKVFIFHMWYYYLLAIGFSSLYFDFRRKRLLTPRWLRCYCFFTNGVLLLTLPFYCRNGMVYLDAFIEKPLLVIAGRFNVVMQSFVILYTLTMRHHHDQRYYGIAQRLLRLEWIYFEKWLEAPKLSYDRLFYLKLFTLFFQNITLVLGCVTILEKRSLTWDDYLLNVYFFIIWNTLYSITLTYFLTLLHIVRRYDVLNIYLQRRLRWLNAAPHDSSVQITDAWLSELRRLLDVHEQLQTIVVQTNNLYRSHITAMLLIFFLSSTVTFYLAFMNLAKWSTKQLYIITSFLLFALKSFDVFLTNHCCEILVARHSEALSLLKRHQHRLHCTNFSLNVALSRFTINIYGMFNLNHRATLAVLRNAVMHALILIQFDYIVDPEKRHEN
ncbi:putative gustatory receptor 59d [Zeugodacus cucurbitae]|uniref:putative gustatory receptor 59d n=1 Tax=Zeugodacus cucurbitae TaxID=28588 RepID=UPI0005969C20|nr:putative gustatory receptor 59d [Zeugodacus cucurbitae]